MKISKKATYCVALAASMAAQNSAESVINESMRTLSDSELLYLDLDKACKYVEMYPNQIA